MSFAGTYLSRYGSGSAEVLPPPDPDLSFCVVIPVYREPALYQVIESLYKADISGRKGELILVFNHPADAASSDVEVNNRVISLVRESWSSIPHQFMQLRIIERGALPMSKPGPGFARKIGMDTALQRFDAVNNPDGVIISLDADTVVSSDYFNEIFSLFDSRMVKTSTFYFEHLRVFNKEPVPDPEALMLYEIYLRVLKLGLDWAGYPHSFHSLGSSFAVRASAYMQAGGMGTQKSAEDFYFLQKCVKLGQFYENNLVRVYPSGRESDRVLFGTGPFISAFRSKYPNGFRRYSWRAFEDLSALLHSIHKIDFQSTDSQVDGLLRASGVLLALDLGWKNRIQRAQKQAGSLSSFTRWLWRELDGLQMVHYMNEHDKMYGSDLVMDTASALLKRLGFTGCTLYPQLVLKQLRAHEKGLEIRRIS